MTEAERLADALEELNAQFSQSGLCGEAAAELRRQQAEIERLNQALTWEQNRSGRIGTHGPGCHTWGPSHYECLLRVNQELLEALKAIVSAEESLLDLSDPVRVAKARIAIAKAQP